MCVGSNIVLNICMLTMYSRMIGYLSETAVYGIVQAAKSHHLACTAVLSTPCFQFLLKHEDMGCLYASKVALIAIDVGLQRLLYSLQVEA